MISSDGINFGHIISTPFIILPCGDETTFWLDFPTREINVVGNIKHLKKVQQLSILINNHDSYLHDKVLPKLGQILDKPDLKDLLEAAGVLQAEERSTILSTRHFNNFEIVVLQRQNREFYILVESKVDPCLVKKIRNRRRMYN